MSETKERTRHLLLLGLYPSDVSLHAVKVAFEPPISQTLSRILQDQGRDGVPILDVAIESCDLDLSFDDIQRMFALLYRLICSVSTRLSIDVHFDNEIDCQIHLFHKQHNVQLPNIPRIPDLAHIAELDVSWQIVFSPESENDEEILQYFKKARIAKQQSPIQDQEFVRIPAGLRLVMKGAGSPTISSTTESSWGSHFSVAVGGTFDHLHVGHKVLLSMTALVLRANSVTEATNRSLIVGITGDDLLRNKKYAGELEDWGARQAAVEGFLINFLGFLAPGNTLIDSENVSTSLSHGRAILNRLQSGIRIYYVEIFDPFGPTITDPEISALIISGETRSGGKAVNDKRREKNWQPLTIFEVDVLDSEEGSDKAKVEDDFAGKISSTEIRSRLHKNRVTIGQDGPKGAGAGSHRPI